MCAGDSITGWNNFGRVTSWPNRTYPEFLQRLCEPSGLMVANGGIAGEVSQNGIGQVQEYLELFPNARYFVVGYGTNDLGIWPRVEQTSPRIIENLDRMVTAIRDGGREPMLLNVPQANESLFPRHDAEDLHRMRDYHNDRLRAYCVRGRVPLADICSKLRDEHFADELHPNEKGAQIIAEEVFRLLPGLKHQERKLIDRRLSIRRARSEDRRGEARMMNRVGVMLGLEAERLVLPVDDAPLPLEGPVKEVGGVELYRRLGRAPEHRGRWRARTRRPAACLDCVLGALRSTAIEVADGIALELVDLA